MPPFQFLTRAFDVPTAEFSLQWQNLGDLFTMLLLLGGDVISRALAQLSGTESFVTPVAFSFGKSHIFNGASGACLLYVERAGLDG